MATTTADPVKRALGTLAEVRAMIERLAPQGPPIDPDAPIGLWPVELLPVQEGRHA